MKKAYEKPVMVVEEFELSQTIATGCSVLPQPGESIMRTCAKKNGEVYNPGSAHPTVEKFLEDTNKDGKISKAEWDAAVEKCDAEFARLGDGHDNIHASGYLYKGEELPSGLFSS